MWNNKIKKPILPPSIVIASVPPVRNHLWDCPSWSSKPFLVCVKDGHIIILPWFVLVMWQGERGTMNAMSLQNEWPHVMYEDIFHGVAQVKIITCNSSSTTGVCPYWQAIISGLFPIPSLLIFTSEFMEAFSKIFFTFPTSPFSVASPSSTFNPKNINSRMSNYRKGDFILTVAFTFERAINFTLWTLTLSNYCVS